MMAKQNKQKNETQLNPQAVWFIFFIAFQIM